MLCMSVTSSAYDLEADGFLYSIDSEYDKTCMVVKGDGEIIDIPSFVVINGCQYNVIGISGAAFSECSSIRSVTIPESVEWIGWGAFRFCSSLQSVTISATVKDIGYEAFAFCLSLSEISVSPDNPNFCSVDGVLFNNKECTRLLCFPNGKYDEYVIPDSVTEIGEYAFEGCTSLSSVTIPGSVIIIGSDAFSFCSSLVSVFIQDSVTEIRESAFNGCSSLTSFSMPDSVKEIGASAFKGCSSLTSVKISDSVTSIGEHGFFGCSSLTSIFIPSSVEFMGNTALGACYGLSEISVSLDNPNYCSVDGVLFNKDCSMILAFPNDKCKEYVIPDFVREIGPYAFSCCISLISVIIPNSVTAIDPYAFSSCTSLISVSIPDSVTEIGFAAFDRCNSLTSVTLPGLVKKIGELSFFYCFQISSVYYNCDNPIEIYDYVIFSCQDNATLYVPEAAVDKCKITSPWKDFKSIEAFDFTGVESVSGEIANTIIGRYNPAGTPVDDNYKGLVMLYFSDGTIQKVIQK